MTQITVSYETIIGLEVHAQMNTKTKMFCGCDNDAFGKPSNSTVCPVCMGHPGTLPMMNTIALKKAMQVAASLKCKLSGDHHMDRKNYFYPDLPMGYQVSQYDFPLATNGIVVFDGGQCRINRLHIENDAGKLIHMGGRSYCDYNRSGTPLMEIVTEPDLRNADDAVAFAKELQRILVIINASEADMYKGMMRFDASISLRPMGEEKLYPRSEIKNLNSFKSLSKALRFEEGRLRALWDKGNPQDREVTVHWDDDKEEGIVMRDKESAADYRYFPEPDIPPFKFTSSVINDVTSSAGELPGKRKMRYITSGLSEDQAILLTGNPRLAEYFDSVCTAVGDVKRAASVVLSQLLGFLKAEEKELTDAPEVDQVINLCSIVDEGVISSNSAKDVLEKMVQTGKGASKIIEEEDLQQINDIGVIEKLVQKAIKANPHAIEDYKNGKERALGAIVGFVMKESNGQADPRVVNDIVRKLI